MDGMAGPQAGQVLRSAAGSRRYVDASRPCSTLLIPPDPRPRFANWRTPGAGACRSVPAAFPVEHLEHRVLGHGRVDEGRSDPAEQHEVDAAGDGLLVMGHVAEDCGRIP